MSRNDETEFVLNLIVFRYIIILVWLLLLVLFNLEHNQFSNSILYLNTV